MLQQTQVGWHNLRTAILQRAPVHLELFDYLVTLPIKTLVKQILKQATTSQARWNTEVKETIQQTAQRQGLAEEDKVKSFSTLHYTAVLANLLNFGQISYMHCNRWKRGFYWKNEGSLSKSMRWLFNVNETLLPRVTGNATESTIVSIW